MKVAFDLHHWEQPNTGNGRYTRGLYRGLKEEAPARGMNIQAFGLGMSRFQRLVWPGPRSAHPDGVDVIHSQYVLPLGHHRRSCLTIHDAAFAIPGMLEYSRIKLAMIGYFARCADAVVTVSEAARRDLERYLPPPHAPILVVPNGCELLYDETDDEHVQATLERYERPYIVYVGRMTRRKQIPHLIRGFAEFRRRHPEGTLFLIGQEGDATSLIQALMQETPHVIWWPDVSETVKAGLLRHADALTYLSTYEGFGLPVAEGLLAGVPVIHYATPALEEVGHGYTHVVRTLKTDEIADALETVLYHWPACRVHAGQHWALSYYSWRRCARDMIDIYRDMIG